jgi:hypothetical protein
MKTFFHANCIIALNVLLSLFALDASAQEQNLQLAYSAQFQCTVIESTPGTNTRTTSKVSGPLSFYFMDNGSPLYNQIYGTYSSTITLTVNGTPTPVSIKGTLFGSAPHPTIYRRMFYLCNSDLSLTAIGARPQILSYIGTDNSYNTPTLLCPTALRKGSHHTSTIGLALLPGGQQVTANCVVTLEQAAGNNVRERPLL